MDWGKLAQAAASMYGGAKGGGTAATGTTTPKGTDWGALIGTGMNVAGNLAAGKSAGRQATNVNAMQGDQVRLAAQGQEENALQGRGRLQIDQREEGRNALNDAYKNAIRSAIAMNMQDSTVSGLPKGVPNISFSGGLRPSAMGAEGRNAASAMNASAMRSLLNPESLMSLPAQQRFTGTPMQQPGALENTMGVLGAVGSGMNQAKAQSEADTNDTLVKRLIAKLQEDQKVQPAPIVAGGGGGGYAPPRNVPGVAGMPGMVQ